MQCQNVFDRFKQLFLFISFSKNYVVTLLILRWNLLHNSWDFFSCSCWELVKLVAQLIRICWRKGLCFRNAFSQVTLLQGIDRGPMVWKARTPSPIKLVASWSSFHSLANWEVNPSLSFSFTQLPLHWTMLRVRCLRGGSRGAEAAHLIGAMVGIMVVSCLVFFFFMSKNIYRLF